MKDENNDKNKKMSDILNCGKRIIQRYRISAEEEFLQWEEGSFYVCSQPQGFSFSHENIPAKVIVQGSAKYQQTYAAGCLQKVIGILTCRTKNMEMNAFLVYLIKHANPAR